jgi:hypothetical protein
VAGVATVPLKVRLPGSEPKFVPAMVTDVPDRAESGEILLMLGGGIVKSTLLLAVPSPEVTTTNTIGKWTSPLPTRAGTVALMLVLLQDVIEAVAEEVAPLKVTFPVP